MAIKIDFFPELGIIQNEINTVFERFLSLASHTDPTKSSWIPLVDCYETEKKLVFKIEIPGVDMKSLKIEVRSGYLFIEGIKLSTEDCSDTKFLLMERSYGTFNRYIPINVTVDSHSATASIKDGILIVSFEKLSERRNRAVPIKIQYEE
jgi:HSP20 family protein